MIDLWKSWDEWTAREEERLEEANQLVEQHKKRPDDPMGFTARITRSMWERIHVEAERRNRHAPEMVGGWILAMLLKAENMTDEELKGGT